MKILNPLRHYCTQSLIPVNSTRFKTRTKTQHRTHILNQPSCEYVTFFYLFSPVQVLFSQRIFAKVSNSNKKRLCGFCGITMESLWIWRCRPHTKPETHLQDAYYTSCIGLNRDHSVYPPWRNSCSLSYGFPKLGVKLLSLDSWSTQRNQWRSTMAIYPVSVLVVYLLEKRLGGYW